MKFNTKADRELLISTLKANHPDTSIITRKEILAASDSLGMIFPSFILNESRFRAGRGMYDLTEMFTGRPSIVVDNTTSVAKKDTQVNSMMEIENLIPVKDDTFVPFGFYSDLKKILNSQMFYPIFISGLSGNGKTTMVEQICANLNREAIRVNISIETDEDDLIGGNTLVNGNVVYREGPVLTAMQRGAVLILDEVDRGSNKLMCLQAILEGKSYFNKKTGNTITPADGFTIIATANTKGRGSDDGKFISAQLLDEAFLERFAITVEQEYPTMSVEKKIVLNKMTRAGCVDEDFATHLVTWSDVIRKTYMEGAIDELVSTRRLEHIVNAFAVFKDKVKAITLCTNRFDEDTKQAFIDLYSKVDPSNTEDPTWQAEIANGDDF